MTEATKSSFSFIDFVINECALDFTKDRTSEISIDFNPSGKHFVKTHIFKLFLDVKLFNSSKEQIIEIKTESTFQIGDDLQNTGTFFTKNAPAIIFPYIRAFISSLSVQSGHKPIVIPTLNLTGLTQVLEANISAINEEIVQ
jgi:preprotein translocase subunit SecB